MLKVCTYCCNWAAAAALSDGQDDLAKQLQCWGNCNVPVVHTASNANASSPQAQVRSTLHSLHTIGRDLLSDTADTPGATAAAAAVVHVTMQFFADTEIELKHPRPNGFPASGIWGYRIANVALNLLNYFWFYRIARKAVQLLGPSKKRSKGRKSQ